MHDPNLRNFYNRVGRIENVHRRGGGFEAEGALGMADFRVEARPRRLGILGPAALVLGTVVLIKAAILVNIGDAAYAERVARLSSGTTADRVGAYVLQADPLTVYAAALIERLAR
jgi:hypothetical protein